MGRYLPCYLPLLFIELLSISGGEKHGVVEDHDYLLGKEPGRHVQRFLEVEFDDKGFSSLLDNNPFEFEVFLLRILSRIDPNIDYRLLLAFNLNRAVIEERQVGNRQHLLTKRDGERAIRIHLLNERIRGISIIFNLHILLRLAELFHLL